MENKDIKVSVIIPVYNTEKYIREAAESIMKQTLKELEIIIINDGSTDRSLEVIEELAAEDERIRCFSQCNKGLSLTRNRGIECARGTYLYFMDSDDLLEADAMELCYAKCEKEQLDFAFFDAVTFMDGEVRNAPSLSYSHTEEMKDKVFSGPEAFKSQLACHRFTPSACLSFINRNFLTENRIQFYPKIIHEDQLFTVSIYLKAKRVSPIHRSFFHRRLREDSIVTRRFALKNWEGYETVAREVIKLKQETADSDTRATIDLYLSQMLNAVAWQAHTLPLRWRLRLAYILLVRYKRYVSARAINVMLFKAFIH